MLVYQKTMFDRYYCIKSFCHLKTLEKRFKKIIFVAQKHEEFVGFENACSRAKTYVILTSLNYIQLYACYCWWRQFLWWLRIHKCSKVQKPLFNSMWLAWLIHGFLPVKKTWLLIACNMTFYPIISIECTESGWIFPFRLAHRKQLNLPNKCTERV